MRRKIIGTKDFQGAVGHSSFVIIAPVAVVPVQWVCAEFADACGGIKFSIRKDKQKNKINLRNMQSVLFIVSTSLNYE